jgi:hypothetical protein
VIADMRNIFPFEIPEGHEWFQIKPATTAPLISFFSSLLWSLQRVMKDLLKLAPSASD